MGVTTVFNVLDYPGADPTGATDSSKAIQKAINLANTPTTSGGIGGIVYFPPGKLRQL